MSLHIEAHKDEVAERVLLPGDPIRAKWIAETYLKHPKKYNDVRGMYGFTGSYNGIEVSVQATGMGVPSAGIYIHELLDYYQVKKLIRVGSAGSYQNSVKVRDLVIALSASYNSSSIAPDVAPDTFAPCCNSTLLQVMLKKADALNLSFHLGNVLTSDTFYALQSDYYKKWQKLGTLCVEMETAILYTLAARFNAQALSLLTISDSLVTGEHTTTEERATGFKAMTELALESICA